MQTADDIVTRLAERLEHIDQELVDLRETKLEVFAAIKVLLAEQKRLDRMLRATQPRGRK